MVYAVPFGALKQYIGSNNPHTLSRLQSGGRMSELDDLFKHTGAISAEAASEHLIAGAGYAKDAAGKYTYLLEDICRSVGAFLDNSNFCPFRGSYLEDVGEGLASMGLTRLRWSDVYLRGNPFDIPGSDDFPMSGFLTREEAKSAYQELRPRRYIGGAAEIGDAIETIREWLAICTRREQGLICFYY
jgi:hypothetical protein